MYWCARGFASVQNGYLPVSSTVDVTHLRYVWSSTVEVTTFTIALPSAYRAFLAHFLTSAVDAKLPEYKLRERAHSTVTTPTTASVSGGGFALPFALPTNL